MPSFCVVETCKLVKQSGDGLSFHKFPQGNQEILKQWIEFVAASDKDKKPKKISKYSSICGRHFLPSDFSQSRSRKFLKKSAVPSIFKPASNQQEPANDDESVEVQLEDSGITSDICSLCANTTNHLTMVYEDHISLIRKCLPFSINSNYMQKLCYECIKNMNAFSSFLDKVICAQHILANSSYDQGDEILERRIKVEPISSFDDEPKSIATPDYLPQSHSWRTNQLTPQKKCEILEIVDIKPFNFDLNLPQEHFEDEDDIQILSPKQLKVELTDPDEDGSNELELIKNYLHISTVFLQDHNYVKEAEEAGVKTEHDDEMESLNKRKTSIKACAICQRKFKSVRKYLCHKIVAHRQSMILSKARQRTKSSNRAQIRKKMCAKVIERKMQKISKKSPQRKRIYSCPICQKVFSGPKNLYQHKISHTSSSNYSCNLCNKKFKRPHGLKQHVKSVHENEKNHVCPICNYAYLLKADMIKCRHSKLKKFANVQLK